MKVFFSCSTKQIDKYAKQYRAIRNEIIAQGNKINRDWIDYSIGLATRKIPEISTHTFYGDVMTAILTADAVIIDATVRSMALGHQVTHALQNNKPLLLMRFMPKDNKDTLFIEGSNSKNLNVSSYNSIEEAKNLVKQFLHKYQNMPKKRFNLVLTGILNNYINWAAFHYRKTKTDVIHEAVENAAEHDEIYKKYLSKQP